MIYVYLTGALVLATIGCGIFAITTINEAIAEEKKVEEFHRRELQRKENYIKVLENTIDNQCRQIGKLRRYKAAAEQGDRLWRPF